MPDGTQRLGTGGVSIVKVLVDTRTHGAEPSIHGPPGLTHDNARYAGLAVASGALGPITLSCWRNNSRAGFEV